MVPEDFGRNRNIVGCGFVDRSSRRTGRCGSCCSGGRALLLEAVLPAGLVPGRVASTDSAAAVLEEDEAEAAVVDSPAAGHQDRDARGRGPGGNGAFIGNRRNAGRTQVRGSFFYTFGNSALDAAPYSLNGQNNTKAAFSQNRFGFNLGGPLEIPKLFKSENTFFFINYTGNLQKVGQNLTGTVPTLAERGGDFSAVSAIIYDPHSGLPFANNQITPGRISQISQGLLGLHPEAEPAGDREQLPLHHGDAQQ